MMTTLFHLERSPLYLPDTINQKFTNFQHQSTASTIQLHLHHITQLHIHHFIQQHLHLIIQLHQLHLCITLLSLLSPQDQYFSTQVHHPISIKLPVVSDQSTTDIPQQHLHQHYQHFTTRYLIHSLTLWLLLAMLMSLLFLLMKRNTRGVHP